MLTRGIVNPSLQYPGYYIPDVLSEIRVIKALDATTHDSIWRSLIRPKSK
jgi:hypothetical protein